MRVLLAKTLQDGYEFVAEMDVHVDLIVPKGSYQVMEGLPRADFWRTPAYMKGPDARTEVLARAAMR